MSDNQYYEEPYKQFRKDNDEFTDEPDIIATSHSVCLACTLAALSSLFALFLYFSDKKSNAVRRISVQSIGAGAFFLVFLVMLYFVNLLFSLLPVVNIIMSIVLMGIQILSAICFALTKIRLMYNAYNGFAYTIPLFGEKLRKFE